jgi:predicted MFS family arabinose efflux permease
MLASGIAWRAVVGFLLMPAAASVAIVVAGRLVDPVPSGPSGGFRDAARAVLRPAFGLILLVYVFAGVAYWGSLTFLPRFVGTGSYVVLLALGGVGQVAAGRLADRARFEGTLLGLSLGAAVLLGSLTLPGALAVPAIPWAFGLILFALEPLQNTLVTREVDPRSRGIAFGMTFLSVFGLGSIGAALAGYLLQEGWASRLFGILAAFLGASGLCAYAAGRRRSPRGADAARSPGP